MSKNNSHLIQFGKSVLFKLTHDCEYVRPTQYASLAKKNAPLYVSVDSPVFTQCIHENQYKFITLPFL